MFTSPLIALTSNEKISKREKRRHYQLMVIGNMRKLFEIT